MGASCRSAATAWPTVRIWLKQAARKHQGAALTHMVVCQNLSQSVCQSVSQWPALPSISPGHLLAAPVKEALEPEFIGHMCQLS
jgi:hypothetical protein